MGRFAGSTHTGYLELCMRGKGAARLRGKYTNTHNYTQIHTGPVYLVKKERTG